MSQLMARSEVTAAHLEVVLFCCNLMMLKIRKGSLQWRIATSSGFWQKKVSSRAISKCRRASAGWEKAQPFRRALAGREKAWESIPAEREPGLEAFFPCPVLYRDTLIESQDGPSISAWSMETTPLFSQKHPGKDYYNVPSVAGNVGASAAGIRLPNKRASHSLVWQRHLRSGAKLGSDRLLSYRTEKSPQPAYISGLSWWRQQALRRLERNKR